MFSLALHLLSGPEYGIHIVGKCYIEPTTSRGPIRKIAANYFDHTLAINQYVLCIVSIKPSTFALKHQFHVMEKGECLGLCPGAVLR